MPNQTVRLEIDCLEITRKRERWNLYFLIATEDPNDETKTLMTVTPKRPIQTRPSDENDINFQPEGSGDPNGMIVLERDMPADKTLKVRLWVVQSRDKVRQAGATLKEISSTLSSKDKGSAGIAASVVTDVLGGVNVWVSAAKKLPELGDIVGTFLSEMKDKEKGFCSMDEAFSAGETESGRVSRKGDVFNFGKLSWTWIIE